MRSWRWWEPVVLIAPLVLLAWLAAIGSTLLTWLVLGFWVLVVVGLVVRVFRAARHGRLRSSLGPATDGIEAAQDIYLSRPRAVVDYGSQEPDVTLVEDHPVPDPGDLRR